MVSGSLCAPRNLYDPPQLFQTLAHENDVNQSIGRKKNGTILRGSKRPEQDHPANSLG